MKLLLCWKNTVKKPESLLAKRVANYLQINYSTTIYRFDLAADMVMSIGQARRNKELHGKYNKGYPDLFIARATKKYGGLYIELKATDTVPNTAHTRTQRAYHQLLRQNGYMVDFACGFDEAKKMIDDYMKLKRKKR